MRQNRILLSVSITLIFTVCGFASSLVEVAIRDPGDLELLLRDGFDVVYLSNGNMAEVVLHDDAETARLDRTGLRYFVAQENIESYLAGRLEPGRDDMGGYRTNDEIVEELDQLHEDFPDIVGEPVSIGQSIEEREIWAVKISDNPDEDEDEPEVLFTALIHAREVITAEVLFGVMYHLVENYEDDERATMLVDERQIWFIPCHNPDGYVYNEEIAPDGGGMWRKNRHENEDGSRGVDLNRNFGYMWGHDNVGSSPDPDRETYRGEEAFSEPETQVAREFVNDHNFAISIYFHSYSNLCIYPLGYDYIQAPDRPIFAALADRMIVDSGYLTGTGWEIIYVTNGDSDDWLYMSDEHEQIFAVTVEVGSRNDSFWPPRNRVEPLVAENLETCLVAAEFCDQPARVFRPPSPFNVTAIPDREGRPVIRWETPEDEVNPPVSFRVMARRPGEPFIDDSPEDQELWDMVNFSHSQIDRHSGSHSYRVQTVQPMATLTLREEIPAPDIIRAWMHYDLRTYLDHYIALEVSCDGYDWEPLPGRDTEDLVINDRNLGPGITGESDDWIQTWWRFGDYAGQMVRLRFRYYQFDHRLNGEACYIDDIGPLPGVEWSEVVAEELEEPVWIDEEHDPEEEIEYLVQAVDAEGDLSFWSVPVQAERGLPAFTLLVQTGWSLISAPVDLLEPDLDSIFTDWVERDILILVKNGRGEFYAPRRNYNGIGDWNPLDGYQIKMERADTLRIEGDLLPVEPPIPLVDNWNMVAYLPEAPMPAEEALASITENLVIAKDGYGRFWLPDYKFNNMPDLRPGQGYYLRVNRPDTLVYPAGDLALRKQPVRIPDKAEIWSPPGPENHSLLLQMDAPVGAGRILLIDDDGQTAGITTIKNNQTMAGIAAWGEVQPGGVGFHTSETFAALWNDPTSGIQIPLELSLLEGDADYMPNGISVFSIQPSVSTELPTRHGLINAHPNPFNSRTGLSFDLIEATRVRLAVYDPTGRLVETVVSGELPLGRHRTVWDGTGRPSGLYIARLEVLAPGRAVSSRTKLLLVR